MASSWFCCQHVGLASGPVSVRGKVWRKRAPLRAYPREVRGRHTVLRRVPEPDLPYHVARRNSDSDRYDGSEVGVNPTLSRNCDPLGESQVAYIMPNECGPRRKGGSGVR